MLKIFEYLGIVLFFYSNEHEQIHVHGKYGEYESKAEIFIANEQIVEIRIKTVKGRRPLTGTKLKDFENFLQAYADQIVQKWIDYFAYRKNIVFEQINTPIRWRITEYSNTAQVDIIEIKTAVYSGDFIIEIHFNDGKIQIVDFNPFLNRAIHPSIRQNLNETKFKQFSIIDGNLNWNDYELIFLLEYLYNGKISK